MSVSFTFSESGLHLVVNEKSFKISSVLEKLSNTPPFTTLPRIQSVFRCNLSIPVILLSIPDL